MLACHTTEKVKEKVHVVKRLKHFWGGFAKLVKVP